MKLKYRVHKINLSFRFVSCFYCGILLIKLNATILHFTCSKIFFEKKISYKFEKNESLIRARLIFGLMGVVIILNKLCD